MGALLSGVAERGVALALVMFFVDLGCRHAWTEQREVNQTWRSRVVDPGRVCRSHCGSDPPVDAMICSTAMTSTQTSTRLP